MQELIRDSIISEDGLLNDSNIIQHNVFFESRTASSREFHENLYSKSFSDSNIPDWYFIVIIIVLSGIAWLRIVYSKFLNSVFISAFNYQTASKVFRERSVVQKRFSLGLDLLYLINTSLFLLLLNRFFSIGIFDSNKIIIVFESFTFLLFLIILRIAVMRFTAFIFKQSELFSGFLYHYFIFNKVLGMLLLPFLIAIPYTEGIIQEIIVYTGLSIVFAVQIIRLFRVVIYLIKNVVLIFYLILYLCILEILPVLVVFKLLLSLAQV